MLKIPPGARQLVHSLYFQKNESSDSKLKYRYSDIVVTDRLI